ncbi:DUF4389 domain-containing protein [Nocardioides gilvus]|uniref:DUF4389 domain-containing protein n=1 Tax=Nocardioides gilvus TaxID=1735589 RepID=UPI000D746D6D|nr:DUF4389 domain-containing protein [Nocardioides gilvus]
MSTSEQPPSAAPYPVRIHATFDPGTSRALWLVKWLLALPHYVILAFLWIAVLVTSVIAFFAILLTARYPRSLFDFNVGVLRWSWRVSFYAYGALGTDRYPPFSLHEVADYPAHLEVDHPESLSRGKVLVKSWLLAIPHYFVLGLLLGGVGYTAPDDNGASSSGVGLIGLLVLVAGVFLLFTGRYPERLFALVVGLNRWVFRVAGYVLLMTDRYPPFALDQGGLDAGPGGHPGPAAGPAATSAQDPAVASAVASAPGGSPAPQRSRWTTGRVVALTLGSLLVFIAVSLAGAAGTLTWIEQEERDRDGFMMSDQLALDTTTHAITSESLRLHSDVPGDFLPAQLLGDARLTATPESDSDLFIGIAPTDEVRDYLTDVSHETVTGVQDDDPTMTDHPGASTPAAPGEQDFWVAQDSGTGPLSITWEPTDGDWTFVAMNSDATPVIRTEMAVGAELPVLGKAAATLGVLAALALLVGIALVAYALVSASRRGHG